MSRTIDFYKQLHGIPEPSLQETRTSALIKGILEMHHIAYQSVIGTGILVFLKGKSSQTIALRADMDALPIIETNDFNYVDQTAQYMHACGHDGHMSMLLETLLQVSQLPLKKSLLFIFQPAEEEFGGAKKIIDSGALNPYNIQEIYGIHLWPDIVSGVIATKAGSLMAMNSEFDITIHGKRAHGAQANDGIDAIYIASLLMQSYQGIISRQIDPLEPAVLHTGMINGGSARNIVCDQVQLAGTLRSYSPAIMQQIIDSMIAAGRALESEYNCRIDSDIRPMYPPVINDEQLFTAIASQIDLPFQTLSKPVMPSEDFSYYLQRYPGVFFFLGLREDDQQPPLHSAEFRFDLNILDSGVAFYRQLLTMRGAING